MTMAIFVDASPILAVSITDGEFTVEMATDCGCKLYDGLSVVRGAIWQQL